MLRASAHHGSEALLEPQELTMPEVDPTRGTARISPRAIDPDLRHKFWNLTLHFSAVAVAAIGLGLVVGELGRNTASVRSAMRNSLLTQVRDLDKVILEHPKLFPYFFERREVASAPEELKPQLRAAAELFLDVFDDVQDQITKYPNDWDHPEAWNRWMVDMFKSSPYLRSLLEHEACSWYGDGLKRRLREAQQELQKG
jgi:hypothetical protein